MATTRLILLFTLYLSSSICIAKFYGVDQQKKYNVEHTFDWEHFKEKLLERDEYKQKAVGPLPRTCEEAGATGETKLYTGDVHMEATGFRLVQKTVNCDAGMKQGDEQITVLSGTVQPRDCMDILQTNPWSVSRVYEVFHPEWFWNTPGGPVLLPIFVYCDMETDGGGWTLFQRRQDGSVDFYRNFAGYEQGFGAVTGEHWLGLRVLNLLTSSRDNSLYIRMQGRQDPSYWSFAMYEDFTVSDFRNMYRLGLGSFTGNDTHGDMMTRGDRNHNGAQFSTFDRDNDGSPNNCAENWQGGYWYSHCHDNHLNGVYDRKAGWDGIAWGSSSLSGVKQFVTMGFRPSEI